MRRTSLVAALALACAASRATPQDASPPRWSFPTQERSSAIAVSPDGSKLYLGDEHGAIWIHGAADGKALGKLTGHAQPIAFLGFAGRDPKLLVSSGYREDTRTWDLATGLQVRRFEIPGDPPPDVKDAEGNFVVTAERVFAPAVSSAAPILAIANPDHRVTLWNAAADAPAGTMSYVDLALGCSFSPDGSLLALAVSAEKDRVEVRRVAGGAVVWKDVVSEFDAGASAKECFWQRADFSPDGRWIVAWGWRTTEADKLIGCIRCYDAATGARQWTKIYDFHVWALAFAPAGDRFAMTSVRGMSLFDPATGDETLGIDTPSGVMREIAFSPDGRYLYASPLVAEGIIRWDLRGEVKEVEPGKPATAGPPPAVGPPSKLPPAPAKTPAKIAEIKQTAEIRALAACPDGRRIATVGDDGILRVWDLTTGSATSSFHARDGEVAWLGWVGADVDRVAAVVGTKARSWRISTSASLREITAAAAAYPDAAAAAAFSTAPPEFLVAVGGLVRTFDADTGREISSLAVPTSEAFSPQCLAVSPDGHRLVVAGTRAIGGPSAFVFGRDKPAGPWTQRAELADGGVAAWPEDWTGLAFSPDGASVFSTSVGVRIGGGIDDGIQGAARCWDAASGRVRWKIDLPGGGRSVALAPRGDVLACAAAEGVRLVSASDGKSIGTFPLVLPKFPSFVFSPDGSRLYAAGGTRVRSWLVSAAK